ncbi:MAG: hypothetical protein FJY82_01405 [Candidatus Aminicenantes bacterium]|nr:hypothetical protein [Candidatus Aminicenantes bacterium]
MPQNPVINIVGRTGGAMVLLAYFLVSTGKVKGDSVFYRLLNLLLSALIIVNSFHFGAFPSVAVNGVWIAIAAFALLRPRPREMAPRRVERMALRLSRTARRWVSIR